MGVLYCFTQNPDDFPSAYLFSAFAKAKLGKVEEAEQAARLGVRIDKDHGVPKLNYVLGILLMQKRAYAESAQCFRTYLEQAPNSNEAAMIRQQLPKLERRRMDGSRPRIAPPHQSFLGRFSPALSYSLKRTVMRIVVVLLLSSSTAFCSVHGVVVDATTHQPIAGAWVSAGGEVIRAGAHGEFQLNTKASSIDLRAAGYGRLRVPAADGEMRIPLAPLKVRGLYMSFWAVASPPLRTHIYETAAKAHLNAVVIDVKGDMGLVGIRTSIPLVAKARANRVITIPDAPGLIADLHARGLYAIARIVVFKDNPLALARPDLAVRTADGALFADNERLRWTDPFRKEVWDYNVAIAVEAAKAGFDEVQFDYVRFPDKKGLRFAKETDAKNRVEAIDGFLAQAQKALNPYNVFLSADNFGYVAWNEGDTGIGQVYAEVGKVVDYISPMLYPSGFKFGIPGLKNPLDDPYRIVYASLERAKKRTGFSGTVFRPWLQAFADYAFDHRAFGKLQLGQQIKAAQDAGSEGWMLWDPRNRYPTQALSELANELWSKSAAAHDAAPQGR
jgi:hypothetical protein